MPVHAGDADAIATPRADRACHVGGVPVGAFVVEDGCVAVLEVPTAHVVDEAVAVVIDAILGVERVGPHVRRQVRVAELDAAVDDRHVDVRVADGALGPGLARSRAVLVRRRRGVAVHAPQVPARVLGVVRGLGRLDVVVGLGVLHAGLLLELRDGCLDRLPGWQVHEHHVLRQRRDGLSIGGVDRHLGRCSLRLRGSVLEAHDDDALGVTARESLARLPSWARRSRQRRCQERQERRRAAAALRFDDGGASSGDASVSARPQYVRWPGSPMELSVFTCAL